MDRVADVPRTRSDEADRMFRDLFAHLRDLGAEAHPGATEQVQCAISLGIQGVIRRAEEAQVLGWENFMGAIGMGFGFAMEALPAGDRCKVVAKLLEGVYGAWDIVDGKVAPGGTTVQ